MRMKTAAIVLAAILACGGAWAARTEADRPGGMRTEAMDGRNAEDYMDASEEDFATFRDAMCYAFSESLVMMTQGADGVMAWYDPATAKRDCIHLSGGGTMDQQKLISLLRQDDYVSGAWISSQLGVTRAGVWKAIEALRASGYEIESAHRRGYRLCLNERRGCSIV